MIAIELGFLQLLTPFAFIACAVAMVVLRAGASRVFFDIVGTFQATKLVTDAQAAATIFEALYMDAIMGVQEAAQELAAPFTELLDYIMPITEEIEEARIEMEKFLMETGDAAKAVGADIAEIGEAYAFSADEAFMAAARMAQLGGVLGSGTVPLGTELGMQFGLISGMDTEEAMQRMINLQQQTKFMTEGTEDLANETERLKKIRQNSMRVLDQLNTVENRSAATMKQITFVMNQFASQAALTNESIAAMAAMSATLIEAGEEQGKGGRALRMIYARLGADTNGARTELLKLGIAVTDAEGNMRPFSMLLQDMAVHYNTLNGAEKQQFAQTVAGNRHYTRLIKLLENVDRVRELEFEAIIAQFPARDEIERRRKTELFQLQEAEAALRNYSGVLGNEMLPALTEVKEQQALYMHDLAALAGNKYVGGAITRTFALAESMTAIAGPVFNAMVSIKNMQISLQTYHAIQRSLNGEIIAGGTAISTQGGMITSNTPVVQMYATALADLKNKQEGYNIVKFEEHTIDGKKVKVHDESMILSAEEIASLEAREIEVRELIAAYKDEIAVLESIEEAQVRVTARGNWKGVPELEREPILKSDGTPDRRFKDQQYLVTPETQKHASYETKSTGSVLGGKLAQQTRLENELTKSQDARGKSAVNTAIKSNLSQDATMEKARQSAKQWNAYSAAAMGAGMALTIFGKSERAHRAGMLLNIFAMSIQIAKTIAAATATAAKNKQDAIQVVVLPVLAAETTMVAAATDWLSKSVMKLGAAMLSLAKKSGPMVAMVAVSYILVELLDRMGVFSLDASEGFDEMNSSMVDTAQVMELIADEENTYKSINEQLAIKEASLKAIENSTSSLAGVTADSLRAEIAGLKQARDIRQLQELELDFDEEAITDYFSSVEKEADQMLRFGEGFVGFSLEGGARWARRFTSAFNPFDKSAKERSDDLAEWRKIQDDFKTEYENLYLYMEKHQITNLDDLRESIDLFGEEIVNWSDKEKAALDVMVNGYGEAKNAITDFNNSREELFYGFSSENLTGDLIRQVNQQGVETLITTTEVIMTNNFNGMTVPEVADEIIAEIESRGNLQGYNFATTG